jgi:hypothetical protein
MNRVAERTNVLTETENKSFIHAVLNAVTKGYSDNTVLEDILDLVRRKEVSKGVIQAAPEALRSIGESIAQSLSFLAEQMENFEIIDETTVKKREKPNNDTNVVEQEMDKQEEKIESKNASLNTTDGINFTIAMEKFPNLEVSEDWNKYSYDKKTNNMTGILKLDFKQDMTSFKTANKIVLTENDIDEVLNKIYSYFTAEFKNLKASLKPEIFKGAVKFNSVEKGKAEVDYEIIGAF